MRTKNILLAYTLSILVLVALGLFFSLSYAEDHHQKGSTMPDVYIAYSDNAISEGGVETKWLRVINGPISNGEYTFFNGDYCLVEADDTTKRVIATSGNKLMTLVVKPVLKGGKHCPSGAMGVLK